MATCDSPTTGMKIWAWWVFPPSVTTQVHWPLCWRVAFTLLWVIFSPCGFSQWIFGWFFWFSGRWGSQTRVTVSPRSTGDDGSADTKGGKRKWKWGITGFFLPLPPFCSSSHLRTEKKWASRHQSSHHWEGELRNSGTSRTLHICKSQIVLAGQLSPSESCPTQTCLCL